MSSAPTPILPSVNGWNADYLESQYQRFRSDPASVAPDLRQFFQGFDLASALGNGAAAPFRAAGDRPHAGGDVSDSGRVQAAARELIHHYRAFGHIAAAIDPFGRERPAPESLNPQWHGLSERDMDARIDVGEWEWLAEAGGTTAPLRSVIRQLDDTYCGHVGVEFCHLSNREEWLWLAERMERSRNRAELTRDQRLWILNRLHRSELFEKFCGKRFPGVKRFSLEGGESLIPMLDRFVERSGDEYGVDEIVFAMSHRGRLNVLTNIIGKTYEQIFTEFEDAWEEDQALGGGDVKYHRGYSENRVLPSGRHVWLCMASNPSHLESAGPVALGRCRAKQRLRGDTERMKTIPLLIHGDAAVIGQGVVAEMLNFSQLPGYTVGGTVHIVVNNLIGFTTGEEDARSSRYCTDFAKIIEAPVLHVNGDDPEACIHAIDLALDYRMTFKKDVFIDLVCYRLHGHNETDEAAFTQPLLYKAIRAHKSVMTSYAERLRNEGAISESDAAQMARDLNENLDRAYARAKKTPVDPVPDAGKKRWDGLTSEFSFQPVNTGVPREELAEIAAALGRWPEGFTPHPKLVKTLQDRARVVTDDTPMDWATAESLAVGSLLLHGTIVRFSGQDSCRGTFSQRHAVLRDYNTGETYIPLNNIRELGAPGTDKDIGTLDDRGRPRQAKYCIFDSPLSEYSVLGFEYGFSLATPHALTMWEAQFGDFANTAQVVIDQYLASAEAKWQRWSGLVLLLPHGYEGQGPEHSSARLERFLQLCANNNMQVVYPTTPAQYFHLLRRQMLRPFRKPLIVMTPKSLLRLPAATSRVSELVAGTYQDILDDPLYSSAPEKRRGVKRVILCTGKVYYDLIARRELCEREDLAVIRLEQLYPLNLELLKQTIAAYPRDVELVWVQEEPRNMGAYAFMYMNLVEQFGWELPYIGRPASATPATGSPTRHKVELEEFLTDAVGVPVRAPTEPAGAAHP